MTIDCLASKKRILVVLHDELPELIRYQFTFSDQDLSDDYQQLASDEVMSETIYGWIKEYFVIAE